MAPKNILLMVADDLGREQVGCYGNRVLPTPNLDALASSGTRFDLAFASTASCSGSRTTLYTGLHAHETGSYGLVGGSNGFQTNKTVETGPEVFNALGYKTGILGKVHVAPEEKYPWQKRWGDESSRDVAHFADEAEAFIGEAKKEGKSFFLTIGYVDPHRVLATRGGFGNVDGNYDARLKDRVFSHDEVEIPHFLQDLPEVRQELAEYYRSINRLDQGVGMVLAALDRSGLADDTLVLFLSDNGPPFVNSKTTLYDAGVRLPFLLRVPGNKAGAVSRNMISFIDVLPTLLDWAGHGGRQAPEDRVPRRGRSILPIADCEDELDAWSHVFGSHTFHEVTNFWPTRYLRTRTHKYHRNVCWKLDFPFAMDLYASLSFEGMRNSATKEKPAMVGRRTLKRYMQRPAEELFDLEADPDEIADVAGEEKEGERVLQMREALEKWQTETKDLWLWRDGMAVQKFREFDYEREGLKLPDRFDFDVDDPGTRDVDKVSLH